jgi:hypothetical protein
MLGFHSGRASVLYRETNMLGQSYQGCITIVSGLPRSGTSMMMQMLAAGGIDILTDNIRRADQDNPKGYYEFEPVKAVGSDASWLAAAKGKAVKMVYLLLYELSTDYQYKIILMNRSIDEVIASQKIMLLRQAHVTDALSATNLAQVFRNDLRKLRAWLECQVNCEVLTVDYNFAIKQPQRVVDEICQFLNRPLDAESMTKVLDADLYRQRLP